MSGHNKWSQIKRQKEASDGQKSRINTKHAKAISVAARDAGGNLSSAALATAIERAKKDGVAKETIDRALRKGSDPRQHNAKEVLFETFGPGGIPVLVVARTDNTNRTSQEIKHILSKHGCSLGAPGSALWAFKKIDTTYQPVLPKEVPSDVDVDFQTLVEELLSHDDCEDIITGTI